MVVIINGQFYLPRGVAFDSYNHLYVTDNHRLQKFNANGKYTLHFGCKGASDGELNYPCGIVILTEKVYIADRDNRRISIIQTNGSYFLFVFSL